MTIETPLYRPDSLPSPPPAPPPTSPPAPPDSVASAAWTERSRPVRTTKKLAQRSKRQNVTVLLAASVLGLWFGVVAPDVSPAAPPAAVAAAAGQPAPVQPAPAPVVVDPFPARGGRR